MIRVGRLVLLSLILTGCVTTNPRTSAELPPTATQNAFGHPVPAGAPISSQRIVSSAYPGLHRKIASAPWRIAHFRPNLNLPEILSADYINDALTTEKAADLQRQLTLAKEAFWTFPRITLLPCDDGCVGNKDYDKMAARFLKTYDDMVHSGAGAYRGQMKIKVRWFRQKSFVERMNPLSLAQQVFAIQFPIEGNVLTLSSHAFGKDASIEDCVDIAASRFVIGVIFPVSFGLRNGFSVTLDPQYDPSLINLANTFVASPVRGLKDLLGQTDYSSRIEPITTEHGELLPAIDGLNAGEGIDVGKGKLFDTF